MGQRSNWNRRQIIAGIGATTVAVATPSFARAQDLGRLLSLSEILGPATDNALDQLSQPDAFFDDEDIRIGLPMLGGSSRRGGGGLLGRLTGAAQDLGVTDGLVRTLNDAAGVAAGEAKPIFRAAIDNLQVSDVGDILREDTGATQYLRSSSNDHLHSRLMPLVDDALSSLGAYDTLERLAGDNSWLAALGISRNNLNETVTDQGLDGIFQYIGNEERDARDNPINTIGNLLGGLR